MSSVVTRPYDDKLVLHVRLAIGGGAPVVEARMASALPLKYTANSAGVMHDVCVTGRVIRLGNVFHNALESPALSNTRPLE